MEIAISEKKLIQSWLIRTTFIINDPFTKITLLFLSLSLFFFFFFFFIPRKSRVTDSSSFDGSSRIQTSSQLAEKNSYSISAIDRTRWSGIEGRTSRSRCRTGRRWPTSSGSPFGATNSPWVKKERGIALVTFDFHSRGTETGILGFLATFTLVPLRMESDRHALPTPTRHSNLKISIGGSRGSSVELSK